MTTTPLAAELLEAGELLFFLKSPFPLPDKDDLTFLCQQRTTGLTHKDISFNPQTGELIGFARSSHEQAQRLCRVLAAFSRTVTAWLHDACPRYRGGIEPDRASFRPDEEATRRLRPHARNDLLHVDAFPGRPARGRRLLRVFVNVHPSEPRVWATSEPLAKLLLRYGDRARRSRAGWFHEWGARVSGLFRPDHERLFPEDVFMLRLHDFLKGDFAFQQREPRRLWRFPPGSAWLAMTDACTYAELRGRYALEHSFFVAPAVLASPELAPARLLQAA